MLMISWPDTIVSSTKSWYDYLFSSLGLIKNHEYKIGHAALVLIDRENQVCNYYDFGRYETQNGFGRVRSKATDPELLLKYPKDKKDKKSFYNDILCQLQNEFNSHGEGKLWATEIKNISLIKAEDHIQKMINMDQIEYGPFSYQRTNCNRFVVDVLKNAKSPNDLGIIKKYIPSCILGPKQMIKFFSSKNQILYQNMIKCYSTKNKTHLENLKFSFLKGTGSSAKYTLKSTENKSQFEISKFTESGIELFTKKYSCIQKGFDISDDYQFGYLSTGLKCIVKQKTKTYIFVPV